MSITRTEPVYHYVKGEGWVASTKPLPRTAEQTKGMHFNDLRTGDAVYVFAGGKMRIGRVHKKGEPIKLNPNDTGAWYHYNEEVPFRVNTFSSMRNYNPNDKAWTELEGVSFPDGKDYEV